MRRDLNGRRTLLCIEERGERLRMVGRDFGIPNAATMGLSLLRDAISVAYREQVAAEERAAMRLRYARLHGSAA